MNGMPEGVERRACRLKLAFNRDLERHGLVAGIALEIAQRVPAIVGPQIERLLRLFADLQAQALGRKTLGVLEIRRAEPHVGEIHQFDRALSPSLTLLTVRQLKFGNALAFAAPLAKRNLQPRIASGDDRRRDR